MMGELTGKHLSIWPHNTGTSRCCRFYVGQKWRTRDPVYGTFLGEVIETFDQGRRGTVVITDEQGDVLDTFCGRAEAFQASGEWQIDPRVGTTWAVTALVSAGCREK
jgi:hypothetical protein